ncbi:MAG: hypothetical protein OYG31_01670 [Candidatus Kaiserbacteria bacterium]|nr:hypothetical protein [Candidatus Kaiserbacteria bacterium]
MSFPSLKQIYVAIGLLTLLTASARAEDAARKEEKERQKKIEEQNKKIDDILKGNL